MGFSKPAKFKRGSSFSKLQPGPALEACLFPWVCSQVIGLCKAFHFCKWIRAFPFLLFLSANTSVLAIKIFPDELSQFCSYAGNRKWYISSLTSPSQHSEAASAYLTSAAFQISPRNRKYFPDLAAYVSFSTEDCTVDFFLWLFSVPLRPLFMSDMPTKKRITKVNVMSSLPAGLRPGSSTA